jgi:hypothetical protein
MEFARDTLGPERTTGLQLEEIESANVDDTEIWLITLSTLIPEQELSGIGALQSMLYQSKRTFKTFTVRKDTGVVVSIKFVYLRTRKCSMMTLIAKHRRRAFSSMQTCSCSW